MKAVFTFDIKKGELDSFVYLERGPLPPIVNPPDPGSPKDEAPPWLIEKKKKIN